MFRITLDGREITSEERRTILEAALEAGTYIPHLCFYPQMGTSRSLPPDPVVYRAEREIRNHAAAAYDGCHLCLVEVEDAPEPLHACTTWIEDGMVVRTQTDALRETRKRRLAELFARHPHACITCHLAEGCNRKLCSMGIPPEQRCCWKFGSCELRKIAEHAGFEEETPAAPSQEPVIDDEPLFCRDYGLCVNCLRCVIACHKIAERKAVGFVNSPGGVMVGSKAPRLKDSQCRFCLACVDVCPTGALREKESGKKKTRLRLGIPPPIWPPEERRYLALRSESLTGVPDGEGVYTLLDKQENIIQITGTERLRTALAKELEDNESAAYFTYEEDQMFTMRERQLIQQYMNKHGRMPPGNDEMDDLF